MDHGLGFMDLATGRFTAGVSGKYSVSWDLYSHLFRNESIVIRLFK